MCVATNAYPGIWGSAVEAETRRPGSRDGPWKKRSCAVTGQESCDEWRTAWVENRGLAPACHIKAKGETESKYMGPTALDVANGEAHETSRTMDLPTELFTAFNLGFASSPFIPFLPLDILLYGWTRSAA